MTRPVKRPHKRRGFAPHQPPPNAAERIEKLAATGHSIVGVARGLNTSADTFRRWVDENPALAEALVQGREAERLTLHNVLYEQATKNGNIVAAMFLLKARHGYREGDQSTEANRVSINFTMPGALSPGEFLKVIEHEQQPADPDKSLPAPRLSRS